MFSKPRTSLEIRSRSISVKPPTAPMASPATSRTARSRMPAAASDASVARISCSTSTARSAPIGSRKTPSASSTVLQPWAQAQIPHERADDRRARDDDECAEENGERPRPGQPQARCKRPADERDERADGDEETDDTFLAPESLQIEVERALEQDDGDGESIRMKRPSPSAAGRTHPRPVGPSAAPAPSRRTIAGIRTSLATIWTDTPATSATATTRAAFASVTLFPAPIIMGQWSSDLAC